MYVYSYFFIIFLPFSLCARGRAGAKLHHTRLFIDFLNNISITTVHQRLQFLFSLVIHIAEYKRLRTHKLYILFQSLSPHLF